jgi:formate hydrogenlyase subunit 6/NADH:ubiquinone oxidoreductase subunit I
MPIAILPDIDEQRCIGCALCVEICTTLGPDVLRVKPVEGWKRGKAFVFYPERCISDGACIGVCPTKSIFWMRPMNSTSSQKRCLHQRLGRRRSLIDCIFQHTFFSYFYFRDFLLIPFGSNLIKFATKLSPLSK